MLSLSIWMNWVVHLLPQADFWGKLRARVECSWPMVGEFYELEGCKGKSMFGSWNECKIDLQFLCRLLFCSGLGIKMGES